ncbi:hypothetical protein, partial [Rhodanobacter lindaniclasticus]
MLTTASVRALIVMARRRSQVIVPGTRKAERQYTALHRSGAHTQILHRRRVDPNDILGRPFIGVLGHHLHAHRRQARLVEVLLSTIVVPVQIF